MDPSKAFDCIPHDSLAAKLHAYGLSEVVAAFVHSYLKCKKQGVQINGKEMFFKYFYQIYHKVLY